MQKMFSLMLVLALFAAAVVFLNAPAYAESLEGSGDGFVADTGSQNPGFSGIDEFTGGDSGTGSDPAPTETPTEAPTEAPTSPTYDPVVPTTPVEPTFPTDPTVPTTPATDPTIPVNTGIPVVTKHPTSESVKDGGYAEFVARADYYQTIEWYISNERTGADFLVWQAPNRFPGLVVTGTGEERLGLNYIPYIMDGWRIRAKFIGTDGEAYTNYAEIYVKPAELKVPTITRQPRSVSLKENEAVNLEVTAMSQDAGTRLTYQWYMNTTDSNVGGKVIYSATSASYVPDYIPGTTYYYCTIRSTDGNTTSQPAKTQCAAVIYARTAPETTVPTEPPTTAPTVPETSEPQTPIWAEATEETAAAPELPTIVPSRTNSLLWILIAAIVVIILLGILATVLILKFYPRDDDDEEEEEVDFIPPAPRKKTKTSDKPAAPSTPLASSEPEWDDLSDLGDLSIYFDDDTK